jgi:hypothetical protein
MEHDPFFAQKPFKTPRIGREFVGLGVDTDYEEIERLFPKILELGLSNK